MFAHILIPIDLAHVGQLKPSIEMANNIINVNGKISLIYVDQSSMHASTYPVLYDDVQTKQGEAAYYRLKSLLTQYAPESRQGECHVRFGYVYEEILDVLDQYDMDAVIMCTNKKKGNFFGSNIEKVVKNAQCTVVSLRKTPPLITNKITRIR